MKKRILYTFIVMLIGCVVNSKVAAQTFGAEQNADGSYTFTFADGGTLTTNTNGSYSATNGTGTCTGCLPAVVVYGYPKGTSTPTTPDYQYTSYSYNNQYYEMPGYVGGATYSNGVGVQQQQVINTNQGPAPTLPPPPYDPCKGNPVSSNSPSAQTPYNLNMPQYASALTSITSTLNDDLAEKGMFLGVNTASGGTGGVLGGVMATDIKDGLTDEVSGNPADYTTNSNYLPFASVHTHTKYAFSMPSVGDIYSLATYSLQYYSYTTAYVIAANGTTTALVVTDKQKVAAFLQKYPEAANLDKDKNSQNYADFIAGTPMAIAKDAAVNSINPGGTYGSPADEEARLNAQAFVLDFFDTGIIMVRKNNTDGKFSQVHYVKTTDGQGNVTYKKFNCN
jgi:hypothetical protein